MSHHFLRSRLNRLISRAGAVWTLVKFLSRLAGSWFSLPGNSFNNLVYTLPTGSTNIEHSGRFSIACKPLFRALVHAKECQRALECEERSWRLPTTELQESDSVENFSYCRALLALCRAKLLSQHQRRRPGGLLMCPGCTGIYVCFKFSATSVWNWSSQWLIVSSIVSKWLCSFTCRVDGKPDLQRADEQDTLVDPIFACLSYALKETSAGSSLKATGLISIPSKRVQTWRFPGHGLCCCGVGSRQRATAKCRWSIWQLRGEMVWPFVRLYIASGRIWCKFKNLSSHAKIMLCLSDELIHFTLFAFALICCTCWNAVLFELCCWELSFFCSNLEISRGCPKKTSWKTMNWWVKRAGLRVCASFQLLTKIWSRVWTLELREIEFSWLTSVKFIHLCVYYFINGVKTIRIDARPWR